MKSATNRKWCLRHLKAAIVAAVLAGPASVLADEQPQFTLTVIEDASHGPDVLDGRFKEAIAELTAGSRRKQQTFESKTNLCVAYTKAREFGKATEVCNAAVDVVRRSLRQPSTGVHYAAFNRRGLTRYLAVALANRGVLRALTGDTQLAREDFLSARNLGVLNATADANLAKLDASDLSDG